MAKVAEQGYKNTREYKFSSLEKALVDLKYRVSRPQDMDTLRLLPTQYMMLLEAARLGLAEFYKNPELLDRLNYPFP